MGVCCTGASRQRLTLITPRSLLQHYTPTHSICPRDVAVGKDVLVVGCGDDVFGVACRVLGSALALAIRIRLFTQPSHNVCIYVFIHVCVEGVVEGRRYVRIKPTCDRRVIHGKPARLRQSLKYCALGVADVEFLVVAGGRGEEAG
jgi:hypothetical protein